MAKTNAQHQALHRERNKVTKSLLLRYHAAVTGAIDAGRASKLCDNLPEEPTAMIEEMIERLGRISLVRFPRR